MVTTSEKLPEKFLQCTVQCPHCRHSERSTKPTTFRQFFYECKRESIGFPKLATGPFYSGYFESWEKIAELKAVLHYGLEFDGQVQDQIQLTAPQLKKNSLE